MIHWGYKLLIMAYLGMAIFTFGHVVNLNVKLKHNEEVAIMMLWPLYWSWELQRHE